MDKFFEFLGEVLARALRFYFWPFERLLREVAGKLGADAPAILRPFQPPSRDQRIAKLDEARSNLEDALSALDELKGEAERNQADLEKALKQLDQAKARHASEAQQLEHIRTIAQSDIAAFRRMAGVPNPNRERLIGFLGGIVASLIAAGLWKLGEALLG